jgi:cobyrinic acid a,c-diamide synthase
MKIPIIVCAGIHSGAGKTTIATGIMAALGRRGLRVQGFKVGPDFIDPTFHKAATARHSYNLDGWMLSREVNLEIFARATLNADVAVIEGVMGLFDGKSSPSLAGTTAEMAMWLDAAVLLVIDAAAMAGSAAALVHGFDTLLPEFRLATVLANRIASPRHYELLKGAIEAWCRPEPIGYLPRDAALSIPERHLGLHLAQEALTEERLNRLAESVESHVNLDRLLELSMRPRMSAPPPRNDSRKRTRIGIALDRAFCFYYEDNLSLLGALGANQQEFRPDDGSALPPADGTLRRRISRAHAEALLNTASEPRSLSSLPAMDRFYARVRRLRVSDRGDVD